MLLISPAQLVAENLDSEPFEWTSLPDLPQAISGQFVGVSNNALIVAGGSYFPVSPFEGGKKVWVNTIYVLEANATSWQLADSLARPLAYGATINLDDGVLIIGGSDSQQMYRDVFKLEWKNGKIHQIPFPPLPQPCAMSGAAKVGNYIYVAGGQTSHNPDSALKNFWRLDLAQLGAGWQELTAWPGAGRILPVVASQDNAVYVISGCVLIQDASGNIARNYLTDGFKYVPQSKWEPIADVPVPVTAAPGISYNQTFLLVFGGDDGTLAHRVTELKDDHPGFSHDVLAYHTITDTWQKIDQSPVALVTTNIVQFNGSIVIPGGEDRPGHRSSAVYSAKFSETPGQFGLLNYLVLAAYLLSLLVIGFYFSKREKSTDDFFLGGKRIPWWAAGLSIYGTQLSAITFMAIPAKAYATDWVYILGGLGIVAVAPIVVYYYLPHFRRQTITTAYEYLEERFNLAVRLFASAAFILFQLGRMGIVIFLPSIALTTVTGIDMITCILLMGVLCTIYTALGGIEAVIWTDVLQVFVLLGGAILSLAVISLSIDGGMGEIVRIGALDAKFHTFNWTWDYTVTAVWVVLFGNLMGNLMPYTSDQVVVQRYLTTVDEKQAARSIWTNAAITIPTQLIFFGLGTCLYVFYKTNPELLNLNLQTDAIFPWFISQELPAGISGLVIAGLFAAAMSSLDSSMNSVSAALVTDFFGRFRKSISQSDSLKLARWLTVLMGIIGTGTALLLATFEIKSLWDVFFKLLGLAGGSLAGIFALAVFTRKANGMGTLVGAISSAVILYFIQSATEVHFFLYAAVGILSCFVIGYLASLIFTEKA